ncbi:bifunctional N(6)-L-threonylcarbamoyladenine synthase/serine/threonine protein kinase [Natronobacterium gregoryi]|uniref:Probable bifunctional tRNA threonylcarbamoyladenosine biosynthesis protein n=2 Tax=Natronobacterium gregoryi TaxID=44930 RepID=L0AJQ9_NATGS|nr:bifunctional N(6)-L-threonylcarbamoyladenine synthase/serine/threonine protein kinase [Natronobacterium gregoryi]AFZ73290.1 metallohydrolase, glycoprotease/Kae1 family [Natronobacterium gregoryi SP2]ELY73934.1 bifunctional UGMP family protein/serine/threonine protein kinase [Natronobacterium gregoryi SP2]PLK19913.1 Kae1-associated kinase Bud32 [Natronobacterium gregoryi SP2]SFJ38224.1 bifunctional N6-L-threonylcarbamoyladenine synthase / protein kinase Bud32 [Natronobacterium gregoryi]
MSTATRVLGIEGTAWAASAAVFDSGTTDVFIETDAYQPESGGIHPREAAEHMHDAVPQVVEQALAHARKTHDGPPEETPVDAVAFSQGPGLGPCLRTVGTAARALSQALDVPLVGVNHMVAHLEIGRHTSGFDSPVCLNASGANAHLLAYRNGRYRVLGETMDTGVGNAIDKFTRHVGWSHPGGPKVEAAAKDGEYVALPYVVKGMDFSFSGIMSAAKQQYDDGTPVEDVCYSLQENIFGMLTEVSERALSLTGSDELVLGGGVGQNARLREMLEAMCTQRGAAFHAPEPRFLRDNAGMIAVLGAKMYEAGDTLALEDSRVDPDFRPDQVPVTWRADEPDLDLGRTTGEEAVQGAEATVDIEPDAGRVRKRREPKEYRHPTLDERLRTERTRLEARLTTLARREGVPTPVLSDVDPHESRLELEYVGDSDLREGLTSERVREVGRHLARLHEAGFVHGDPTTRNVRADDTRTYLIDFGLGYHTDHVEDYAMDLHVFDQSLVGTAEDPEPLHEAVREGYRDVGDEQVLARLRDVEGRGRYVGE